MQSAAARAPIEIENLSYLSTVLARVEGSATALDPGQYRALVQQLQRLLGVAPAGTALDDVLARFPSTAALYENLHYGHAGLCRAPLEHSLLTEQLAVQAIAAAKNHRPA